MKPIIAGLIGLAAGVVLTLGVAWAWPDDETALCSDLSSVNDATIERLRGDDEFLTDTTLDRVEQLLRIRDLACT